MRVRLGLVLASLALVSCTRHAAKAPEGIRVLDEDVQLVRGEHRDSARREIAVDRGATFVAFVHEEDCDVTLRLATEDGAAASEVNNSMYGEALEVAVLDVPARTRLIVSVDSAQDFDVPCHSRVEVQRYDDSIAANPRVAARLDALRSWSTAMRTSRTVESSRTQGLGQLGHAAEQLESGSGDRWLAAWARLERA
ncbi:MAG TPA: hypothetical protein VGF26_01530, partial [Ramlibacter sp.]